MPIHISKPHMHVGPLDPAWAWIWKAGMFVLPAWEGSGRPRQYSDWKSRRPTLGSDGVAPTWEGCRAGWGMRFNNPGTLAGGNSANGWRWNDLNLQFSALDQQTIAVVWTAFSTSNHLRSLVDMVFVATHVGRLALNSTANTLQFVAPGSTVTTGAIVTEAYPNVNVTVASSWSSNDQYIMHNGQLGASTTPGAIAQSDGPALGIGYDVLTGHEKQAIDGVIPLVVISDHYWSRDQAKAWSRDPFGFLRPMPRRRNQANRA